MTEQFMDRIAQYVKDEISRSGLSLEQGNHVEAFRHLERAHVLGQASTFHHTYVHWLMLKLGWRARDWREVFGQLLRIIGASTKTPFGIYPEGNTGGSNVWFFKSMPIPEDLQALIRSAKLERQ